MSKDTFKTIPIGIHPDTVINDISLLISLMLYPDLDAEGMGSTTHKNFHSLAELLVAEHWQEMFLSGEKDMQHYLPIVTLYMEIQKKNAGFVADEIDDLRKRERAGTLAGERLTHFDLCKRTYEAKLRNRPHMTAEDKKNQKPSLEKADAGARVCL